MKTHGAVPLTYALPEWCHTPCLPVGVAKELRVILPAWAFVVTLTWLAWGLRGDLGAAAGTTVFLLGCTALGALSVGHEFAHGTLGVLLAQPLRRQRLWWTKMGVLGGALITAALPVAAIYRHIGHPSGRDLLMVFGLVVGPVLSGWCVAPWLTLLTRNTLAGAVFTAALPTLFWVAGGAVAAVWLDLDRGFGVEGASIRFWFTAVALAAHWAVGAALGHRRFVRLEALEGGAGGVLWSRGWGRRRVHIRRASRPGSNTLHLVRKELRLQQITWIVAGLFALGWLIEASLTPWRPDTMLDPWGWSLLVYWIFVPLLGGALSCAEERQFGTLGWHLTLPVSAWRQWCVKALTVVGVTTATGVVLPLLLVGAVPAGFPAGLIEGHPIVGALDLFPLVFLLTVVGMYCSSTASSSLRALFTALPLGIATVGLYALLTRSATRLTSSISHWLGWLPASQSPEAEGLVHLGWLAVGCLGLVLAFGNYRTLGCWSWRRFAAHLACLGTVTLLLGWAYVPLASVMPDWSPWETFRYWGRTEVVEPTTVLVARPTHPMPTDGATNLPFSSIDPALMQRYGLLPTPPGARGTNTPPNAAQPSR